MLSAIRCRNLEECSSQRVNWKDEAAYIRALYKFVIPARLRKLAIEWHASIEILRYKGHLVTYITTDASLLSFSGLGGLAENRFVFVMVMPDTLRRI